MKYTYLAPFFGLKHHAKTFLISQTLQMLFWPNPNWLFGTCCIMGWSQGWWNQDTRN